MERDGGLQQHADIRRLKCKCFGACNHWLEGGHVRLAGLRNDVLALSSGVDLNTFYCPGSTEWSSSSVRFQVGRRLPLHKKGCPFLLPRLWSTLFNRTASTMPSTYSSSSNAYTTYFVPGYGISRHIMFTVWLISVLSCPKLCRFLSCN